MIAFPGSLIPLLRVVFRRALRLAPRQTGPDLQLIATADGLRFRAQSHEGAVEYHHEGTFADERIRVPFALLHDCQAKGAGDVTVEETASDRVTATWSDKQIPQNLAYTLAELDILPFPPLPDSTTDNPPGLWRALSETMASTDPDSGRYALQCVQLCGAKNRMAAADGRHLFVRTGFDFPWDEDLLLPASPLFRGKDLAGDNAVRIGHSGKWLMLQTGPWRFHLALFEGGRFPRIDDVIASLRSSDTHVRVSPEDASFLTEAISRLPCPPDDANRPITIELGEQAVIRAENGSGPPTELVLSGSTVVGKPVRMTSNRHFLDRAVQLGCRRLHFFGKEGQVQALGDEVTFVWMPLGSDGCIQPHPQANRIESAGVQTTATRPVTPSPTRTRRPEPMSPSPPRDSQPAASNGNGNGKTPSASNGNGTQGLDELIEQAETVRGTLRAGASQMTELITALKQQKKASRSVKTALATLRQLEDVTL